MTPALILNKLDLDLAPAGLLVALGLVSVIFVVVVLVELGVERVLFELGPAW